MFCLVSQSLCPSFFSFYHCWHLVLFHNGKLEFRYYFHFPIFVDLRHILWYILNKVPCAAEKDMYSLAFVGEVPQISVRFILFMMPLTSVSLLICTLVRVEYWIHSLWLGWDWSVSLHRVAFAVWSCVHPCLLHICLELSFTPWRFFSLINMKWPHLSLLVTISLKSLSSDIRISMHVCPQFPCLEHLFPFFLP